MIKAIKVAFIMLRDDVAQPLGNQKKGADWQGNQPFGQRGQVLQRLCQSPMASDLISHECIMKPS